MLGGGRERNTKNRVVDEKNRVELDRLPGAEYNFDSTDLVQFSYECKKKLLRKYHLEQLAICLICLHQWRYIHPRLYSKKPLRNWQV